ncbi:chymotrypsin-2-like [Harmonia axyridis]|uniref:chymotrypsin-2-like n=1 Tax=Harmonia axyridis TaxID=115357 RepID=UPI001E277747|nr:chymotrypsin-2-like [Harmonia axyridis]
MRSICHIIFMCHYMAFQISSCYEEPPYSKYPFVISIQEINSGHLCSGSLVGFRWVLTSAHCVLEYEKTPESIYVVAGGLKSSEEQIRSVEKIYCHDKFDSESMFNNIALLLTDQPFLKKKSVDVCYVPKYTMHIEMKTHCKSVELVGFEMRKIKVNHVNITRPILTTFKHTILSNEDCAKMRKFEVMKHTFCGYAKNMTACMRDTGGPAICEDLLYGITFYGCPWDESPSYFTRVDRYLIFIERIMGKEAPYHTPKRSSGDELIVEIFSLYLVTFLVFI